LPGNNFSSLFFEEQFGLLLSYSFIRLLKYSFSSVKIAVKEVKIYG